MCNKNGVKRMSSSRNNDGHDTKKSQCPHIRVSSLLTMCVRTAVHQHAYAYVYNGELEKTNDTAGRQKKWQQE